jgi:cysteine synthase A
VRRAGREIDRPVMQELLPSTVEAIGRTPVVELSRLIGREGVAGRILAKLDYLNPGFSKKDRIARQMIEDAEKSVDLRPGQTVVELTSGNTGSGLAIVCGVKGYPFVAVMSRGNSMERARMMAALGAEVVLVDQLPNSKPGQVSGGDLTLVEEETQRIVKDREAFRADQFLLEGNFRAHYLYTGPEFLEQAGGGIDAFCDFVGSGGTMAGCAAAFKEHDPDIRCYIVEPDTAAVLAGNVVTNPNHPIQGGGYSMPELHFINRDHIDGYLQVTSDEAIQTARKLAKLEGIFAGFSSGANVAAALQLLRGEMTGKTVAVMMCDSGLKYLSTDLWESTL